MLCCLIRLYLQVMSSKTIKHFKMARTEQKPLCSFLLLDASAHIATSPSSNKLRTNGHNLVDDTCRTNVG